MKETGTILWINKTSERIWYWLIVYKKKNIDDSISFSMVN